MQILSVLAAAFLMAGCKNESSPKPEEAKAKEKANKLNPPMPWGREDCYHLFDTQPQLDRCLRRVPAGHMNGFKF